MLKGKSLSVIIPAYNEGPRIRKTLEETVKILKGEGIDFEIIVVDDGSKDNTHEEVLKSKKLGNIKCVHYKKNRGKGHAIRKGFGASTKELITFIDADMDLHPIQIPKFLRIMDIHNADMVTGSKIHPDSDVEYPPVRSFLSGAYRLLIKTLFNIPVRDTQVGLKLMRRGILEKAFPVMEVTRYAYDLELMVIAHRHGYKIVEAPVKLDFQKPFARIGFRDIYTIFLNTMSILYRLKTKRYNDD